MKIAVQRQIIDTDNIYSISEILEDTYDKVHYFIIESFNEKIINVSIKFDFRTKEEVAENPNLAKLSNEDYKTFRTNLRTHNKNKLEKMRQDIVKIWSENQSSIPNFNIKNYE